MWCLWCAPAWCGDRADGQSLAYLAQYPWDAQESWWLDDRALTWLTRLCAHKDVTVRSHTYLALAGLVRFSWARVRLSFDALYRDVIPAAISCMLDGKEAIDVRRACVEMVRSYVVGVCRPQARGHDVGVAGADGLRLPPSLHDVHRLEALPRLLLMLRRPASLLGSLQPHGDAGAPGGDATLAADDPLAWLRCTKAVLSVLRLLRALMDVQPQQITAMLSRVGGWRVLCDLLDTEYAAGLWRVGDGSRDEQSSSAEAGAQGTGSTVALPPPSWFSDGVPSLLAVQYHVLRLAESVLLLHCRARDRSVTSDSGVPGGSPVSDTGRRAAAEGDATLTATVGSSDDVEAAPVVAEAAGATDAAAGTAETTTLAQLTFSDAAQQLRSDDCGFLPRALQLLVDATTRRGQLLWGVSDDASAEAPIVGLEPASVHTEVVLAAARVAGLLAASAASGSVVRSAAAAPADDAVACFDAPSARAAPLLPGLPGALGVLMSIVQPADVRSTAAAVLASCLSSPRWPAAMGITRRAAAHVDADAERRGGGSDDGGDDGRSAMQLLARSAVSMLRAVFGNRGDAAAAGFAFPEGESETGVSVAQQSLQLCVASCVRLLFRHSAAARRCAMALQLLPWLLDTIRYPDTSALQRVRVCTCVCAFLSCSAHVMCRRHVQRP